MHLPISRPKLVSRLFTLFLLTCLFAQLATGQGGTKGSDPVALFLFDGSTIDSVRAPVKGVLDGEASYVRGFKGKALRLTTQLDCRADKLPMDGASDFSVQCWIRTTVGSDRRIVLVSQKDFGSNSLYSQKRKGWVFYLSHGTWAWNMGSGTRRITYERDNGESMPLNDGRWHQLTMTYSSARSEVRLYFDGIDRALYNIGDSDGFKFSNENPLTVGSSADGSGRQSDSAPTIEEGAKNLQKFVDAFNGLGLNAIRAEEFVDLIVDPRRFFARKVKEKAADLGRKASEFLASMKSVDLTPLRRLEAELMKSPYTVHQSHAFMEVAPLLQTYALVDGRVTIRETGATAIAERERLDATDFDIDNLAVWDRVLSREEVRSAYAEHFEPVASELDARTPALTAAAWNIEHGGKHYTMADDGWDSRVTIAEMIKREGVDLVMMQETYSSGDFIAAELGYYFATTVDWDYLNQGANISVLSRYPIQELYVPPGSTFSNVAVKVAVSKTQDLYVMSNWYGMQQFPAVFKFHESRFAESDATPTLFAGDFNAVPHTDGGKSPASRTLLAAGFVDAFRDLHRDAQKHPGASHKSGRRIDQLYYKGAGLKNTSTRIVSTWPTGFPSDHFMIVASFDLSP